MELGFLVDGCGQPDGIEESFLYRGNSIIDWRKSLRGRNLGLFIGCTDYNWRLDRGLFSVNFAVFWLEAPMT